MNSVVANGEEGPAAKQWDQPLTTADMRARAADWSLADDSRMLAYLEAFTQSVTARTCEIQKQLESLVYETQVSSVKVSNVINDFNHLSSLQFVENRVYDEEAKDGAELKNTPGDVQQPSGDQEAALVVRVSEAFRLGVEVLRSSLEVIDLHQEGDSDDSDEEEAGGRERNEPLLRALDPYLARPLPPLIGSDRFLADDRVGLGELLSEDEADEKSSSRGGECEEEEDSGGSDIDSDLLLVEPRKPAVAIDNKMADYMQREFGGSQAESDEDVFATADREELHSKSSSSELDSDGDESADVGRDGVAPKRSTSPRRRTENGAKGKEDALFGLSSTEDGPEGEKASPFVRKSGLFAGDGKLFDDDSDEGDLFRDVSAAKEQPQEDLFADVSTAKQEPQRDLFRDVSTAEQPSIASNTPKLTASGKKIPVGGVSLFGGAALPVPSERRSDTKQEAQAQSASTGGPVHTDQLASSMPEGEDEDPLFGSLKKETPPEKQATGTEAVTPANIFGREKDTSSACAVPKNSHSTGKPAVAVGGLFDEDGDDDDDLWASTEGTKVPQQEPSVPFSEPVATAKDLLKEEPPPVPKAESTSGKAWKKHSLFDDEDEDDFLFSAVSGTLKTESKPAKSFLFSVDDEDFFTSGSVNPSLDKAASHEAKPYCTGGSPATKRASTNKSRTASRGVFLFEDEDEPGKPIPAASVSQTPPLAAVEPAVSQPISLFTAEEEAVEDDEDLFSERTPPTHLADSQSSHSVQSASWSVGSKGESEPASVVHVGAVPEGEPAVKLRSGSRFLFDQEDELFKSSPDINVDVDLFAPPKPSVADSSPKKKPVGGVSLFGGSSLFGDELRSRLERTDMPAAESAKIPSELGQEEDDHLFSQSSALSLSRPALRDTKVTPASFDEPADQNKTLVSATKGRVKVKVKRRLPSRKKLQADAQDGESGSPRTDPLPPHAPSAVVTHQEPGPQLHYVDDTVTTKESVERDQQSRSAPLPLPPQSGIMVKSPSTEEEDLFAVVENQVPEVCQKPNPARLSQALFAGSVFDDYAEEVLFTNCGSRSALQLDSGNEQTSTHGFSDAIFEAGQLPDDNVLLRQTGNSESSSTTATPSEGTVKEVLPQEVPKRVSGSIFDDGEEDSDIFAPSAKASSSARSSRRKQDTLFDDETDDIFSSKLVQPKVSKSEKKGSQPSSSAKRCLPRTTDFKDPLLGDLNDE
ncbi:uncharacterized protein LOC144136175 isoform X2 [Amblyomma americanum]